MTSPSPLSRTGPFIALLILLVACGPAPTPTATPFATSPIPSPTIPLITPSTGPSASSASTATPATTATPAASSTASAEPTATPIPSGEAVAVLLSHVPAEIVSSCTTTTGEGKILAKAKCSAQAGKIDVTYFLYADYDSMFSTYDGFRVASQIERNSGNCNDPASWPAETDFAISGQVSGRVLCTQAMGATTIYWTDNRLNIFSEATDSESNQARLVEFWTHDAGPNLHQ